MKDSSLAASSAYEKVVLMVQMKVVKMVVKLVAQLAWKDRLSVDMMVEMKVDSKAVLMVLHWVCYLVEPWAGKSVSM